MERLTIAAESRTESRVELEWSLQFGWKVEFGNEPELLEEISGIGEKTVEQLLKKFKSVKRIKEASLEDLSEEVGWAKAKKIYENFH